MAEDWDDGGGSGGDSYSETTRVGWFSRIGEAIKGMLVGLILFVISFPLLFWNEGRAVKEYQSNLEGERSVITVPADKVDPGNEGKLVHISGKAVTDDTIKDADFGVDAKALRLKRIAQIFQWKETEKRSSTKNLGGSETRKKDYTYEKVWANSVIDSAEFKHADNHHNTGSLEFNSYAKNAAKITVGAFALPEMLSNRIAKFEPINAASIDPKNASEAVRTHWKPHGEWFHRGKDPSNPEIGDLRVKFEIVDPLDVSLFAKQVGDSFQSYQTKYNAIDRLEEGIKSAKTMFDDAQAEAATLTWILRLVGFLLMAIGIYLLFKPFVIFADVVPFLGSMMSYGIAAFAGLVALSLSLMTIAIAWIFYRPILGVSLLAAGVGLIAFLMFRGKKAKTSKG